ncbi:RNA-directed DNA polymerase [Hyphomonas adhaerens MHS-3]|uniref:RNA-directed DNA polymerase n=1 Tax=Hyphomonas adhaerens MHS-3 TaxID=1280949 RepID=A0A069E7C8_9PROT|nr:reverse transcriptase domain-containing protein [Hyphomonas adhaerens]KCZ83527.1 RNA-directed DNA polymerase [Hyphomonas adhaerens MHS-3]
MQNAIKVEIKRLAKRAFEKEANAAELEKHYQAQFAKRTGLAAGPSSRQTSPPFSRHFDPKYCARHANFLAKTIWHKVLTKAYEPAPAICYAIPKPDGSHREVMAFSIPDAALANIVLRRSRDRNIKRLSPASYAYHPDKNVFDAILALREFDDRGKLFAVQIDFEKYFDNIPSRYLKRKLEDSGQISLTPHEKHIFDRFMHHQYAYYQDYASGSFKHRHKGTPQGSSVSLLLANLANHDLDVDLTAAAGRFVRFADDVVALSSDYAQAQLIEKCFLDHCRVSGLKVNATKSPGIAIVSSRQQELRTIPYFDYLGYRFSPSGLTAPDKTIRKLKARVSRLANLYLIHYLHAGFNNSRCSGTNPQYDWDLLGLIYELRRSIYGGLSEAEISGFIERGTRLPRMKGLMGFYCLLDDPAPLKELDGWMLSIVRRAMRTRYHILASKYGASCPKPTNKSLATGTWLDPAAWQGPQLPESRMPSLVRGWRAARKHFYTFGLENVEAPKYGFYSDFENLFGY